MLTLPEIAQSSESDIQRGIIKRIVETSPFLMSRLTFLTRPSMRHTFSLEGDLPASGPRALNSPFTPSNKGNAQGNITLKQYGGAFELDDETLDIENIDGVAQAAESSMKMNRSIALNWKRDFIKGSVAANAEAFDGIEVFNGIAAAAGYDVEAHFGGAAAVNGTSLAAATATDVINLFNDMQNKHVGSPDFYITHRPVGAAIDRILLTAAANEPLASKWRYEHIEVAQGMFSNPLTVRVGMYENIPVYFIDQDATETDILGFNETKGSSNDSSSIYAVKIGPDFVAGLQKRATGPIMRQKPSSVGVLFKIDWPTAVHMGHPKAVVRGTGLRP